MPSALVNSISMVGPTRTTVRMNSEAATTRATIGTSHASESRSRRGGVTSGRGKSVQAGAGAPSGAPGSAMGSRIAPDQARVEAVGREQGQHDDGGERQQSGLRVGARQGTEAHGGAE